MGEDEMAIKSYNSYNITSTLLTITVPEGMKLEYTKDIYGNIIEFTFTQEDQQ